MCLNKCKSDCLHPGGCKILSIRSSQKSIGNFLLVVVCSGTAKHEALDPDTWSGKRDAGPVAGRAFRVRVRWGLAGRQRPLVDASVRCCRATGRELLPRCAERILEGEAPGRCQPSWFNGPRVTFWTWARVRTWLLHHPPRVRLCRRQRRGDWACSRGKTQSRGEEGRAAPRPLVELGRQGQGLRGQTASWAQGGDVARDHGGAGRCCYSAGGSRGPVGAAARADCFPGARRRAEAERGCVEGGLWPEAGLWVGACGLRGGASPGF